MSSFFAPQFFDPSKSPVNSAVTSKQASTPSHERLWAPPVVILPMEANRKSNFHAPAKNTNHLGVSLVLELPLHSEQLEKNTAALESPKFDSRMLSEGFPFIVGVWGWTCVRVAFVDSSSARRRQLVNSLPCRRAIPEVFWEVSSNV